MNTQFRRESAKCSHGLARVKMIVMKSKILRKICAFMQQITDRMHLHATIRVRINFQIVSWAVPILYFTILLKSMYKWRKCFLF